MKSQVSKRLLDKTPSSTIEKVRQHTDLIVEGISISGILVKFSLPLFVGDNSPVYCLVNGVEVRPLTSILEERLSNLAYEDRAIFYPCSIEITGPQMIVVQGLNPKNKTVASKGPYICRFNVRVSGNEHVGFDPEFVDELFSKPTSTSKKRKLEHQALVSAFEMNLGCEVTIRIKQYLKR